MSVRFVMLFAAASVLPLFGQATILSCQATANPPLVRAEGITERTGDIGLNCFGGQPNALISGNLSIFLNVAITNRIFDNGTADSILLVDNGSGFQLANVPPRPALSNSLVWAGLQFRLSDEGKVNLRMQNVRGAATQLNPNTAASIVATLAFNAGALVSFLSNGFSVGTVQRGLYISSNAQMVCSTAGSPSPVELGFHSAIAQGTAYSTVRVTEGFPSAFAPMPDISNQNANSGIRIILRYSGIPAGARIFVPTAISGTDSAGPTSAGDFGFPLSSGYYTPGRGNLLLARVANADANGGGGFPAFSAQQFSVMSFGEIAEISYHSGGAAGYAVYEVLDADSSRLQSALIPSLLDLAPQAVDRLTTIRQDVLFASLSSLAEVRTAPTTHIPRFVSTMQPPNDCSLVGDCNAFYFPRLAVNQNAIEVVTDNSKGVEYRYITISNSGSGNLVWNTSVTYTAGSNNLWLTLSPPAGINRDTIRAAISPSSLAPGNYEAQVLIDAGPWGKWTVRIAMRVNLGPAPAPIIQSVTNAALKYPGPLVAGSLATIGGSRFSGVKLEVYFNSMPGRILSSNPEEILVQVPLELKELPNANVTVISDGVSSLSYYAYFANSAPGIFPNYLVNPDLSVNTESNPITAGQELQILLTGLPLAGVYTATIHDRERLTPVYAGVAPGLIGIQLIQVAVPVDLPTMTTEVRACGGPSVDDQSCSPPRALTIREAPQQQ